MTETQGGTGAAGALPFDGLGPEVVLDAVESAGLVCDGRLFALNSFENRVYQVGLSEGEAVVAKFYRANRWSDEAILEEHSFSAELAEHEIPVVAPLSFKSRGTLLGFGGFRFALFPKMPGRTPELEDLETLERIGRFLGRLHAVGRVRPFRHRPALNPVTFGDEPLAFLAEGGFVPDYLRQSYFSVAGEVLKRVGEAYARGGFDYEARPGIRLHGDCHPGNILMSREGPSFVDLDDCRTGPAIQDLWMLLTGDRAERHVQLQSVMDGYADFADFDRRELALVEPLRALRMIHHAAWLARRYDDPAFKAGFPWFNTPHYWEGQVLALREQASNLDEPPLELD